MVISSELEANIMVVIYSNINHCRNVRVMVDYQSFIKEEGLIASFLFSRKKLSVV